MQSDACQCQQYRPCFFVPVISPFHPVYLFNLTIVNLDADRLIKVDIISSSESPCRPSITKFRLCVDADRPVFISLGAMFVETLLGSRPSDLLSRARLAAIWVST